MKIDKTILPYTISSIACAALDYVVFFLLIQVIDNLWVITFAGRAVSATTNFIINRKIVFRDTQSIPKTLLKYIGLLIISGTISTLLQRLIIFVLHVTPNIWIKGIVELALFLFNYVMQKNVVFHRSEKTDE